MLAARVELAGSILASLARHPIVRPVDRGVYRYSRGLVAERIEGPDLRGVAAEGPGGGQAADSVGHALAAGRVEPHQRGLGRREVALEDIAAEQWTGRVALVDFGCAKPRQADNDDANLTLTNDVLGRVGDIPPEAGAASRWAEAQADRFAAGIVLLEPTTGEMPPRASEVDWFIDSADPSIDPIIGRATAIDPADRYASAGDLPAALDRARPRGVSRRLFGRG